jgi:hypothetical protein
MMIQRRDDDLVTRRHVRRSPRRRHEVERFRGAAREDQAVRVSDVEEARDAIARLV